MKNGLELEPPVPYVPATTVDFDSLDSDDNAANAGGLFIPPDPIGVAGPDHVVLLRRVRILPGREEGIHVQLPDDPARVAEPGGVRVVLEEVTEGCHRGLLLPALEKLDRFLVFHDARVMFGRLLSLALLDHAHALGLRQDDLLVDPECAHSGRPENEEGEKAEKDFDLNEAHASQCQVKDG